MASFMRRVVRTRAVKNIGFMVAMYSAAELTQQTMIGQYDATKTMHIGTTCLLFNGPANHFWYKLLDGVLRGTSSRMVFAKTALDIFVFTPFSISGFFIGMSILEGHDDIYAELRDKFKATYSVGLVFWTVAQAVNFYVVPPPYRVLYVGTVAFVWANFICYMKQRDHLRHMPQQGKC
ncbi:mpv17-like protein [Glandiceps talaboti]